MSDNQRPLSELAPHERINEMNRRVLAGEDFTEQEIITAINDLRADRAEKTQAKTKKVAAKAKEAEAGEDLLSNL